LEGVLFFDAPESALMERITGRWTCPRCGRVYQRQSLPSDDSWVCQTCGSPLVQREEDNETVVRKRYAIYQRETEPLVGYYRAQGKLTLIDAMWPIDKRVAASVDALQK